MVLAVNTSNSTSAAGTSVSTAITTTVANCIIYFFVKNVTQPATVTVTDSVGLTWTRIAGGSGNRGGAIAREDVYWALMPSAGAITVTATIAVSNSMRVVAVAVSGANTTTPVDVNANAATYENLATASPIAATAVSTTNANTILFLCLNDSSGLGTVTPPAGYTQTLATGTAMALYHQIFSATQSAITPSFSFTSTGDVYSLSAVALQAAGGAALSAGTASTSANGATTATVTVGNASGGTPSYTYQWYRSTTNGFTPGGGNIIAGATSQTLNDTGLTAATTYYYVNVVTDSAGSPATANSNQVSVTTNAALASGTASTTSSGNTIATVTCGAATGGKSSYTYQWKRSTTSGSGYSNVSGATSLTLNDTGLTNGTTYYYVLVSTDADSATVTSNEVSATPSAVLTAGTASTTSVGSTIATVTVGVATFGSGTGYTYQWYRSTSSGFTPGAGNILAGATSRTLNDTGLTNGTTYYYVNKVTDSLSATANSNQVSAAPAALAAGTASNSSVGNTTATMAVANASGGSTPYTYQWYRSTTNGFTPGAGNLLAGATSQTLNDTGLTNGTTYYYRNIVTDAVSNTSTSNQASAVPVAALTAGAATAMGTGSTTASASVAAATGGTSPYTYQWYRSTTINFTPGAGNILAGATSLTLSDTGLTAGTTYYYKNVVTDNVSATSISNQASALPFNVLVRGIATITGKTPTTVSLSCTAASGGTGTITYQWYRSIAADSGFTAISGATSRTLTDTGLTTGTPYFYYCQAMDSASITPSNTIGEIPPKTVFLGFIGDSWNTTTTASGGSSGTLAQSSASLTPQKLQALFTDGTIITGSNAGVGGTNGNDWAPGGTDLNAAESQFNSAHSTHSDWIIQCHLGINDSSQNFSSPSGGESPAQYYAYMNAIANELINVWGCGKLVFVAPPYIIDGAAGGTNHTTAGVQRLYEYQAQLQLVAANYPGKCFANLAQFNYFLNAWSTDLGSDNVHPTFTDANGAGGATNVSTIWATYLYQVITGKFIGSGGGGGSRAMRMGI